MIDGEGVGPRHERYCGGEDEAMRTRIWREKKAVIWFRVGFKVQRGAEIVRDGVDGGWGRDLLVDIGDEMEELARRLS
jgi:hypothetical protein